MIDFDQYFLADSTLGYFLARHRFKRRNGSHGTVSAATGEIMRLLIAAALLSFSFLAAAQGQLDARSPTGTKGEAFLSRTGVVIIRGFSTVGVVSGKGSSVIIDVGEFRDASNPRSAQYGVRFEVHEQGMQKMGISLVDEDEIDPLIRGLEQISKIHRGMSALPAFRAGYRTQDHLEFDGSFHKDGRADFVVRSGQGTNKATAHLKLSDADSIRNLLEKAKRTIATLKQAAK